MRNTPGSADIDREFDRLKRIREISLNRDLVVFVEKSYSSLRSQKASNRRDYFKRSLLHYAAMGDCTNLFYYLLQSAPDIESRDMYGRTPLSYAAEYGSLDVVKILLERGANVNAMDYEGSTPLTWLIHAGNPKSNTFAATEAYLKKRGAKEDTMKGMKRAWVWVLTYSRLLRHVRPRI
jgi:ankyrin repeat protein